MSGIRKTNVRPHRRPSTIESLDLHLEALTMTPTTATAPQPTPTATSETTAATAPNAAFAGVRRVPPADQRPQPHLRPRIAGTGRAQGAAGVDGGREDRDSARHRRQGDPHRQDREVGDAARPPARAGRVPQGRPRARPAGDRGRRRGAPRVGELGRGRIAPPSCCAPPSCWPRPGARRSTRRRCSASRRRRIQAEIDAASEMIDFWRFNA